ncbi:DUF4435 domain-containing protein [Pseudomonas syringae]|uniref:DUF4435 domain-containing protein n=1 Tax=Pseudomonas syringae TaxID=317 RepID=UPI000EFA72A1|nr:DUF4435 domain-containing protein [Pseudomonas syringae]
MTCLGLAKGMSYEADELLNTAIMTKIPVVIVEGLHDIPIYERIMLSIGKECDIYASENILCEKPGCAGVEENILSIREASDNVEIEPYVLGIVDRDARYYRGEIPNDTALLVLEMYSIETHFVSLEAVRILIEHTTRATRNLVSEEDLEAIYSNIIAKLSDLFLYSLEALRKACDRDYVACFGYADKIKAILNSGHEQALAEKESELMDFALRNNVPFGWEGLISICKGKWLLELFIDEFRKSASVFPNDCREGVISQCQSCLRNAYQNCLYKLAANFDTPQLQQILFQDVSQSNFDYIKTRLSSLV